MSQRGSEQMLIRDEHRYCAHPHMAALASGTWLLVATCGPRRAVTMHPPQDPEFINVMIRSDDEGRTWSPAVPVPAFGSTGAECAGLTALGDGAALLNQWRFRWYPAEGGPSLADEPLAKGPQALWKTLLASREIEPDAIRVDGPADRMMPWVRGGGSLATYRSQDDGRTWGPPVRVDTGSYAGGYGMRGAVTLPGGDLLLPLSDVPFYERVFAVRSSDGGRSWGPPEAIAAMPGRAFEEPAAIVLADGTVLILLRENVSRTLYATRSHDGGRSWSPATPTGIEGYPAHLLRLEDGRIAAVVGNRRAPYSISIVWSLDDGLTFGAVPPTVVRDGLPSKDLGYPTAALRQDGSIYVAYYYRDAEGVTGVHATTVAV